MNDSDNTLRTALRDAQANAERGRVADFESTWIAAEERVGRVHKRHGVIAAMTIAAAVAGIAIGLLPSPELEPLEQGYIDPADLLGTTSWFAPSDSLLPEHEFDIYQEIPLLDESTETYGGALL